MATDVKAKIEELEKEQRELKEEIEQVKASLEGHAAPFFTPRRSEAFKRAGLYGGFVWRVGRLQTRLSELTANLTALRNELAAEKNLEARRAEKLKEPPWSEILATPAESEMPVTADQVRDFLKSELRKKVLVPEGFAIPADVSNSFESAKMTAQDTTDATLLLFDELPVSASTENSNQGTWEKTIDRVIVILRRIRNDVSVLRNTACMGSSFSTAPSSRQKKRARLDGSRLRPDVALLIGGVLTLLGEEKTRRMAGAVTDIIKKLMWTTTTHGPDLPYLLAISAAATKVQFFVVESGTSPSRVKPVSDPFDISDPAQRFAFIRSLLNAARLCLKLRDMIGDNLAPKIIPAGKEGLVTLWANGAVKYVPLSTHKGDQEKKPHVVVETLKALYAPKTPDAEYLKSDCVLNKLPNCVHVERAVINADGLLLTLKPRGETVAPKPERVEDREVVLAALRDVLKALEKLHQNDWVHRDIRWPNILRVKDANDNVHYILIDFDYAARGGNKVTWTSDAHPKEAQKPKSQGDAQVGWTAKHDLWQVGSLLAPFVNNNDALKKARKVLQKLSDDANVIKRSYSVLDNITLS